jgi:hypothetical protein
MATACYAGTLQARRVGLDEPGARRRVGSRRLYVHKPTVCGWGGLWRVSGHYRDPLGARAVGKVENDDRADWSPGQ